MSQAHPSRPAVDNATILEAAACEFAEKGFAGARVDDIARSAGVNKATLYYRIGDKAALYEAVLERYLGQTADAVERECGAAPDCEEKLRGYIRAIATNAEALPALAPIMLRETAGGGRHLPEAALRHMGRIIGGLTAILEAPACRERFRQRNPMVAHMMVIGSVMFYVTGGAIRQRVAAQAHSGLEADHLVANQQMADEVADMLLAALRRPDNTQAPETTP